MANRINMKHLLAVATYFLKAIFVVTSLFLFVLILRDISLHSVGGEHRAVELLGAFLMIFVAMGAGVIFFWENDFELSLKTLLILFLGFLLLGILWGGEASFIMFFILGVQGIFAYGLVKALPSFWVRSLALRVYPTLALVVFPIAFVPMFSKDVPTTLWLIPAGIFVGFFLNLGIPILVVLFPAYAWVFVKTKASLFSFAAGALMLVPVAAFVSSNFWAERWHTKQDPCYEVVEGKPASYFVREKRICVLDRAVSTGAVSYKTLPGVDSDTFEEVSEGYVKDYYHVYHDGKIDDSFDSSSFHSIGQGYVTDEKRVAYQGTQILNADPKTFSVLSDNGEYAKDKHHAYRNGVVIDGADGATFKNIDKYFTADQQHLFCDGKILTDIDLHNLFRFGDTVFVRDNDSLYYCNEKIDFINARGFQLTHVVSSGWRTQTCGSDGQMEICRDMLTGSE